MSDSSKESLVPLERVHAEGRESGESSFASRPKDEVFVRPRPTNIANSTAHDGDEDQTQRPAHQTGGRGNGNDSITVMVPVEAERHLGLLSTSALILNKVIGTGIFVSPSVVLAATGSKGISLVFWVIGCLVAWAGMYIYLEYGIRWPLNGGELYYVDKVFTKPYRLFTYMFSSMFIILGGVQVNALTFGETVIFAAQGPQNRNVDHRLQKFLAIVIITFICQLQAFSRSINVRISNALALFKVMLLLFVTVSGWVALGNTRTPSAAEYTTPYGRENLSDVFGTSKASLYGYSLALLNVMRAFLGYENANFVLQEVKVGPTDDPRSKFKHAVKLSVFIICFLYVMANVAFFAACTTEELLTSPDTLTIFLEKVYGKSDKAYLASNIVVSLSAAGNIMSLTFANVRVKQEIGRLGIMPPGEYWAETTYRRTPGPALLLHWIFSIVCVIATPLSSANGFLIMSTLYSYTHTWISVMLGGALLLAPWLKCFRYEYDNTRWERQSTRLFGYWLLAPLILIYVLANAFIVVLSWVPANVQKTIDTQDETLPSFAGPVAGHAILAFGAVWWAWDVYLMPYLGYYFKMEVDTEYSAWWKCDITVLKPQRTFDPDKPLGKAKNYLEPKWKSACRRLRIGKKEDGPPKQE